MMKTMMMRSAVAAVMMAVSLTGAQLSAQPAGSTNKAVRPVAATPKRDVAGKVPMDALDEAMGQLQMDLLVARISREADPAKQPVVVRTSSR